MGKVFAALIIVGVGPTAFPQAPTFSVSPATLNLGVQPFHQGGFAPQTVTIAVSNNTSATVTGVSATGDFTATEIAGQCPSPIQTGSPCNIAVSFFANDFGYRPGELTVNLSSPSGATVVNVPLCGATAALVDDFTIGAGSGCLVATVNAGGTATYPVAISGPLNTGTTNLSFTCTGAPAGATCTAVPSTASVSGPYSVAVNVLVSTTAPVALRADGVRGMFGWLGWLAFAIVGGLILHARPERLNASAALAVLALFMIAVFIGCGGNSSAPLTPTTAGNSALTFTATAVKADGSTHTHQAPLMLTVK